MSCKAVNIILLLFVVLNICAAANDNAEYQDTYYDPKTNIVAERLNQINDESTHTVSFKGVTCSCRKLSCNCCTGIKLKKFKFNKQACAEIKYQNQAITAALTLDRKQILSKSVPVNALPPICVKVPDLPAVKLCLHFTNLNLVNGKLNFCTNIETRMTLAPTLALHFPCAKI